MLSEPHSAMEEQSPAYLSAHSELMQSCKVGTGHVNVTWEAAGQSLVKRWVQTLF